MSTGSPHPMVPVGLCIRWLQTQPYEVQREIGLNILRKLGILK